MQYLSGQRLCFHKHNQDCMLKSCQSGFQHFEGMEPTAGAGRSAVRRRVEWDQFVLNQNIAVKVRHRSELVFARVYLLMISGKTSTWMPCTNLIPTTLNPASQVPCKPKSSATRNTVCVCLRSFLVIIIAIIKA
jgi:hypothetical protein